MAKITAIEPMDMIWTGAVVYITTKSGGYFDNLVQGTADEIEEAIEILKKDYEAVECTVQWLDTTSGENYMD